MSEPTDDAQLGAQVRKMARDAVATLADAAATPVDAEGQALDTDAQLALVRTEQAQLQAAFELYKAAAALCAQHQEALDAHLSRIGEEVVALQSATLPEYRPDDRRELIDLLRQVSATVPALTDRVVELEAAVLRLEFGPQGKDESGKQQAAS